jgi:hypothetical protein
LLTRRVVGRGEVWVLNVRTFSAQDYQGTGERLLAPRLLGWPKIPQALADLIRASFLAPLGEDFRAPSGVALVMLDKGICVYNFHNAPVRVQLRNDLQELPANAWVWRQ